MIDRLLALEHLGIKLGLENIHVLLEALEHPERSFTSIHVAGTNGKGSVTAMVHAALVAAGYRSARYTSPHLSNLAERFVIGARSVDAETLDQVGRSVLDLAERLVASGRLAALPTFFEATTAIAFELFRRAQVEVAVVEVGLGGRFDATNVLSPAVSAIASIGLDHEQYLGTTLSAIAFEKAGIIKPGVTVVTGHLHTDAWTVIESVARDLRAPVIPAYDSVTLDAGFEAGAARLRIQTPTGEYGPLVLGLRGEHQIGNALIAVRLLELLETHGIVVPPRAIEVGLASCEWPGRLELIVWPGSPRRVLIDAAHNPDGARALAAYLGRWHPERPPLVIGVMQDKDVGHIVEALLPVTSTIIATAAKTARALPPSALAASVSALDPTRRVLVEERPDRALDRAFEYGATVCVAGSIFLAGAVRDALRERAILQ